MYMEHKESEPYMAHMFTHEWNTFHQSVQKNDQQKKRSGN
jgi:hypothetical protein